MLQTQMKNEREESSAQQEKSSFPIGASVGWLILVFGHSHNRGASAQRVESGEFQHAMINQLAFLLTLPHKLTNFLFERCSIIPPLYRGIQIRRALVIGIRQHGNDGHENLLHAKDRSPPLRGRLVNVVRIFTRIMQDGDANLPILINIWMPHLAFECHFGRLVRKVLREDESSLEEPSLVESAVRSHNKDFPVVNIAVVRESYGDEINWVLCQL